jgi:hypothetical protein
VIGAGGIVEGTSLRAKVIAGSGRSVMPKRSGRWPIGLCAVAAKRCQNADWMQPAANSWRTRSSASMVSCVVSVGKPYIR